MREIDPRDTENGETDMDLYRAGVGDEVVNAVARVLAEQFAKNPPVNGSKDFRIDARAVLNLLGGAE